MRILVVGGGGREHALCWTIAASPLCDALFCAPGNAGIAAVAQCVPIADTDLPGIRQFCREQAIDFVVVGPEAPLVAGLVDQLAEDGIKAFGPTAAAAQLEGSKTFVKDLCAANDIPTAHYRSFTDLTEAVAYIESQPLPMVVKADGLAAGKGVVIAETTAQAIAAAESCLTGNAFGAAGTKIVVEECLVGEELSFFALVDGTTALPLAGAQDHKRANDGDTGPNTGGMGAYSPAPALTEALTGQVMASIITPTVTAMAAVGHPYKGVLYAGLMLTADGPKLLEYNVRFGDPECQVLMMRLMSDILPALIATVDGQLTSFHLRWYDQPAITVVMAANGYPGSYAKGTPIGGLDALPANPDVEVFHAGTTRHDGHTVTNGGRVLNITARADTLAAARDLAYQTVNAIDWPDAHYRTDIAWRALTP